MPTVEHRTSSPIRYWTRGGLVMRFPLAWNHVTRWTRMRKLTLDEVERLLTDDEIEETLDVAAAVQQYSDEWIDERPSIPDAWVTADLSG